MEEEEEEEGGAGGGPKRQLPAQTYTRIGVGIALAKAARNPKSEPTRAQQPSDSAGTADRHTRALEAEKRRGSRRYQHQPRWPPGSGKCPHCKPTTAGLTSPTTVKQHATGSTCELHDRKLAGEYLAVPKGPSMDTYGSSLACLGLSS